MLDDGLSGAEGAGHGGGTALGDGEQGVDDPLTGLEGGDGVVFALIGAAHADGPFLDHGEFFDLALIGLNFCDDLVHNVVAGFDGPLHGAGDAVGDHDFVEDDFSFGHSAQHVAAGNLVAFLGDRGVGPFFLTGEGGDFDAAGQVVGVGLLNDFLQRALDAVVNIFDDAGAELDAQRRAGSFHLSAGAQAGGLLIDLNGGPVAGHRKDFTDQPLIAHADGVLHIRIAHAVGDDQRAGNLDDLT